MIILDELTPVKEKQINEKKNVILTLDTQLKNKENLLETFK
jgi:hypothetical protein